MSISTLRFMIFIPPRPRTFWPRHLLYGWTLINHYLPDTEGLKHSETFIHAAMQKPNNPKYKEKSQYLPSEKIDVTAFMVWFIENYPESAYKNIFLYSTP